MIELTPNILKEGSREPIYTQLYKFIRLEIEQGRLTSHTKLPSIRQFANHLGIHKNTVHNAYEQLEAEGYLWSRPKSGWFVSELNTSRTLLDVQLSRPSRGQTCVRVPDSHLAPPLIYDFRYGRVDTNAFPLALWRKVSNQTYNNASAEMLDYGDPQGELGLRQELAEYLYQARGVRCGVDQIVLGAGIQDLLSRLSHIAGDRGTRIAFEEPGYDGARVVFSNHRYEIVPIMVKSDGIDVQQLENSDVKLVYITPSHQFPCGMVLPISKRMQLLRWATDTNGYIIEDDYDGEFRYHGQPIPALQELDSDERVIYLGTFSKSLLPIFRIAYMVLPPQLLSKWKALFSLYECSVSRLHQHTLLRFIREGHWYRHLKKMRVLYGKKQQRVGEAIQRHCGDRVIVEGSGAGLHVHVKTPSVALDAESDLLERANLRSIGLYSTKRYWANPTLRESSAFLLGFGGMKEEDIDEGVRRIGLLLAER